MTAWHTKNANPAPTWTPLAPEKENIGPRKPATAEDAAYNMTEQQARNYIEQCIAALDFALRPGIQDAELKSLSYCIKDSVEQGTNVYRYTANGKQYNKEKIDLYINSGILQHIEQTCYNYALEETNNSTVARKIAESMRNNALARMQRNSTLDANMLTTFMGASLRKAVREVLNKFDVPAQQNYRPTQNTPSQPAAAPHSTPTTNATERTFPTPECPVCYDSFETLTRLFLSPCGHNMCKSCAYNWCFTNSNNSCPICRTDINRQKLAEKF